MNTRTTIVPGLLVSLSLLAPSLTAQDAPAVAPETFAEIEADFEAANKAWYDKYREASASEDKEAVSKLMAERPQPAAWLPRMKQLVTATPASDDGGAAAAWMLTNARATGSDQELAIRTLLEHHLGSEHAMRAASAMQRMPTPQAAMFLTRLCEKAEQPSARAAAMYALGEHLKYSAGTARTLATADDEQRKSYEGYYGREAVDVLSAADAAQFEERAIEAYERLIADSSLAGEDYRGNSTYGEAAKLALFELQNLSIGKVAPEIVGEDVDGVPMKLSDYRGKVVVLDFWGDW